MEIAIGMLGIALTFLAVILAYIWRANGRYMRELQRGLMVLEEGQRGIMASLERITEGQERIMASLERIGEGQERIMASLERITEGQERIARELRGGRKENLPWQ